MKSIQLLEMHPRDTDAPAVAKITCSHKQKMTYFDEQRAITSDECLTVW